MNVLEEDRVSLLWDDILINIISRLNLKDAVRTSALSRRWKYLWSSTTSLIFQAPSWNPIVYSKSFNPVVADREKTCKYVNWVNKILETHRALSINTFTINFGFDLGDSHGGSLTNWICTALTKRVQKLELIFYCQSACISPQGCYEILKRPSCLSGMKSLRSLFFYGSCVNGEILEFFIQHCPLLDRLDVRCSFDVLNLKVVGSSVQLNYLSISHCWNMKELEISAPRLVFFKYFGPKMKLLVEDVPQLVDISIGGFDNVQAGYLVDPIRRCFPQMKNLVLNFFWDDEFFVQFFQVELPQLRHLTVFVPVHNLGRLLYLITKACPFWQKLTLRVCSGDFCNEVGREGFSKYTFQYLKVVELSGPGSNAIHLELVSCILETATMLEKVIIESHVNMAKSECLEMLEPKLPQGVQLVVL